MEAKGTKNLHPAYRNSQASEVEKDKDRRRKDSDQATKKNDLLKMDQNFYQDTKKENNAIMDDLLKKAVTHEAIYSIVISIPVSAKPEKIECNEGVKNTDRFVNTMDRDLRRKEPRILRIQEGKIQGEVHLPHEIGVISDTTRRSNKKGPRVHEEHRENPKEKREKREETMEEGSPETRGNPRPTMEMEGVENSGKEESREDCEPSFSDLSERDHLVSSTVAL